MNEKLKEIKDRTQEFEDHVIIGGSDFEHQIVNDRHWLIQTIERQQAEIERLKILLEEKFPFVKSPIKVVEFSECDHHETKIENGIEFCDICGLIFDSE